MDKILFGLLIAKFSVECGWLVMEVQSVKKFDEHDLYVGKARELYWHLSENH